MMSGANLKRARKALGMTWKECGYYLDVTWRTVARWEAAPVLTKRQETKAIRVLWDAARRNVGQVVCPTCSGRGLLKREEVGHGQ